jgi:hypothetical protein
METIVTYDIVKRGFGGAKRQFELIRRETRENGYHKNFTEGFFPTRTLAELAKKARENEAGNSE